MSTPKEGGASANIVPISLRRAPEQGRFHGVKTPEAMRQQRAEEAREAARKAAKELLGDRWGATVLKNPIRVPRPLPQKPCEQRREAEPSRPNPVEDKLGDLPSINSPDQSVHTEPQLTREQLNELACRNFAEWLDQKHQRFVEEQLRISRQREEKSPEPTTDQEE